MEKLVVVSDEASREIAPLEVNPRFTLPPARTVRETWLVAANCGVGEMALITGAFAPWELGRNRKLISESLILADVRG